MNFFTMTNGEWYKTSRHGLDISINITPKIFSHGRKYKMSRLGLHISINITPKISSSYWPLLLSFVVFSSFME